MTSSLRPESLECVIGPRSYWNGPLDVEGLALSAVTEVAQALQGLTGAIGRYKVSTVATFAAFDSLGHLRIDGRPAQGFAPLSGFWRTRDGWLRTHGNYPHHARRLLAAMGLDPSLNNNDAGPELARALSNIHGADADSRIQAAAGIAARVRDRTQWAESTMAQAVSNEPWISVEPESHPSGQSDTSRQWEPSSVPMRPLEGLRVLDFTRVIAGPVATRVLAALGAEVLRIDPPTIPELLDQYIDSGFDKRCATADLRDPTVLTRVMDLAGQADVVVMGYRPGALARFGLEPKALLQRFPHLAVATVSAWGTRGPWGAMRGFDSIVQAASGISMLYQDEHGHPGALPCQALDHATGYGLAAGVLKILTRRLTTGRGGLVRMSLARTAQELLAPTEMHRVIAKPAEAVDLPALRELPSFWGSLFYTPLPLLIDGVLPPYRHAADPPGGAVLEWV